MPPPRRVTLNLGMGFDSSYFAVDYLENPNSVFRDIPCDELVIISSQTGNESIAVKQQMENYLYPILRKHNIRTVQIGRASSSLRDGFVVLDDTTQPQVCHIRPTGERPYWSLSDDLLSNASVPNIVKGNRTCSDKFKIAILDKWHQAHCPGCSRVIGFNADETKRVQKSPCSQIVGFNGDEGSRVTRQQEYRKKNEHHLNIYPLHDKGITRQMIEDTMLERFGDFVLSACTFCSFSQICGGGEAVKERWSKHPDEAAEAAYLEFVSISLNPKQALDIKGKNVIQREMLGTTALELFHQAINAATWKVYEVRRIRGLNIPYRSVKSVFVGDRFFVEAKLVELSKAYNQELKYCHHEIPRLHLEAVNGCEHYFVACPGEPIDKQRSQFETKWVEATKQTLFDLAAYQSQ